MREFQVMQFRTAKELAKYINANEIEQENIVSIVHDTLVFFLFFYSE